MRTQLYIDGQWVDGIGKLPVYDPSDGTVIAEVALAGDAQCEAAIAAADAAAKAWAKTAPRYRSEILRKAFELMTAENEAKIRRRADMIIGKTTPIPESVG
mgnify:CR=1 FL=1